MSKHKFRLFILGSGFSKPAGLPLGVELLEQVRKQIRASFQRFGWEGPLEEDIEEWKELYPKEILNLESVIAYSHRKHFLKLIGSDEYYSHGSRTVVATRHAIQKNLIINSPAYPPSLYNEFAKRLTPYDTIFTFNYDTLLEDTLDEINKLYSLSPEWWLTSTNEDLGEFSKKFIDIFKLHGSIDWYDKSYYDKAREYYKINGHNVPDDDPLFGSNPSVLIESLARGDVEEFHGENILKRVFRVKDLRKHISTISSSYTTVPFLLPPAYDKILGHDPIRDLWENMHRTLDAYSVITIIGYSMPKYDGYAYEALGRLIASYQSGGTKTYFGDRRVPVQIITFSPSEKDVLKSIPVLKRRKTRIWNKGFDINSLDWLDWGD